MHTLFVHMDMVLSNLFNMAKWITDQLGGSFIQKYNWLLAGSIALWIRTVLSFSAEMTGKACEV